jgi:hypothetical protein
MRTLVVLFALLPTLAMAQAPAATSATAPQSGATPAPARSYTSPVLSELDHLQTAASQTNTEIARLKVDKWKADGNSKRQAESNAESIQRNLNSALPGMIAAVRSAPQDIGAQFRLYRNVNALYDVMSSLTESTGAFGPKNDYDALAQQLQAFEEIRRSLGDSVEQLAASTQSQIEQLRTQVHTLQTAAAAAPPKKTVVDDTTPTKSSSSAQKKKTTKKPATSPPSSSTTDSTPNAATSSSSQH